MREVSRKADAQSASRTPRRAPWRGVAVALGLTVALGAAAGCTRLPPPVSLTQAVQSGEAPAVADARNVVPQAVERADNLRAEANAAYDDGKLPAAEALGEQAVAAYERAVVLARVARAEEHLAVTRAELAKEQAALREVDALQARVQLETEHLEAEARVARDAEALAPLKAGGPEREKARWDAVASITTDAALACTATRLLGDTSEALTKAAATVASLEQALPKRQGPAPLDAAMSARAACLGALTEKRREPSLAEPTNPATDRLQQALSEKGFSTGRDERGVVVVLEPTTKGPRLAELGAIAGANVAFPLLVVVHRAKGGEPRAADKKTGEGLAAALRKGGATQVIEIVPAGSRRPLLPANARSAAAANERVEVVFVTPTW